MIPDPRFGTENGADVRSGREALEIAFLVQNTSSSVSSSPSVPPTLSNFSHLPPALAAAVGGPQPFSSFGLATPILNVLKEQGYHTPTPIQAETIPLILGGRDVLGCAQTGTGKTAAFALPIIHSLMSSTVDKTRKGPVLPRVLVLSPTRELATQIADSFVTYGAYSGLSVGCVFGGVSQFHQVRALHRGVDVLIATPGRLMDLMEQGHVILSNIKVFVLDEADRMLDMGFINPIRMIASKVPQGRQTLLFSATMPPDLGALARMHLKDPVRVSVGAQGTTPSKATQDVYMVGSNEKTPLLVKMISTNPGNALVFARTKHRADRIMRSLCDAGFAAQRLHSNRTQQQRREALEGFRRGRYRILVATDIAARGIDVADIRRVINYDLPQTVEDYIHRVGRTARAEAEGHATSFASPEERAQLRAIEKHIGRSLPRHTASGAPAPAETAAPVARHRAPRPVEGAGQHPRRTVRPGADTRPHRPDTRPHTPSQARSHERRPQQGDARRDTSPVTITDFIAGTTETRRRPSAQARRARRGRHS